VTALKRRRAGDRSQHILINEERERERERRKGSLCSKSSLFLTDTSDNGRCIVDPFAEILVVVLIDDASFFCRLLEYIYTYCFMLFNQRARQRTFYNFISDLLLITTYFKSLN
jgi:hypothetical protein